MLAGTVLIHERETTVRFLASAFGSLALVLPAAAFAADEQAAAIARDLDERFAKTCSAGDAEAALGLYADDATVILPGEAAIARDRAAVEAAVRRACEPARGTVYRLDSLEAVRLGPDHVSVVAEWTITAPGADGMPADRKARSTELPVKTGAGWRYLVDHASPTPPAP